jgi:hypothetical protein
MILPIIPLVLDVRFQRLIDPACYSTVLDVVVGLFDGDVVDCESDLGVEG